MNRIYQGRVSGVSMLNPDTKAALESRWFPYVGWEDALWKHHALFQTAVNNTSILGIRLTTLDHFNREAFRRLLHAAVVLDEDPTAPPVPKMKRVPWPMPDFFKKALREKRHRAAAAHFDSLKPSYRREFIVWLTVAKRAETRERRLGETLAALAAGKKWIDRKPPSATE